MRACYFVNRCCCSERKLEVAQVAVARMYKASGPATCCCLQIVLDVALRPPDGDETARIECHTDVPPPMFPGNEGREASSCMILDQLRCDCSALAVRLVSARASGKIAGTEQ